MAQQTKWAGASLATMAEPEAKVHQLHKHTFAPLTEQELVIYRGGVIGTVYIRPDFLFDARASGQALGRFNTMTAAVGAILDTVVDEPDA